MMLAGGQARAQAKAPPSAPLAQRAAPGMEADTNRFGSDYRGFDAPNAQLCQTACANEAACRAWTWVKPGIQGPSGKCWLKNAAPAPSANACCVSGMKTPQPQTATVRTPPAALAVPPSKLLPKAGVSPAQLDFGTLWDGDVMSRTVEVSPPVSSPDGAVRVEIEPSKVFTIAEVSVLGPVGEGTRVPVDNRDVGRDGQARLTVDRTRSRTLGAPLVEVAVRRGDTLAITVRSAPQMNLLRSGSFNGSGPQHTLLKAAGQGWRVDVPVSAAVAGVGLSATIAPTPICAPYGYRPGVAERQTLPVALESQRGSSVAGQVQLFQAPSGLKEDPSARIVEYRLSPKALAQLELPYLIYWEGVRFPQVQGESEGPLPTVVNGTVRIVYGAASVLQPFAVTLKPYGRNFRHSGKDGLEWSVDYSITCEGSITLGWHVFNPNNVVQRDYTFEITWRGRRIYKYGGTVGRYTTDKTSMEPMRQEFLRANYEQILREPPTLHFGYKNHL
jgi:hypothetical protein